jgi:hypothetical protein
MRSLQEAADRTLRCPGLHFIVHSIGSRQPEKLGRYEEVEDPPAWDCFAPRPALPAPLEPASAVGDAAARAEIVRPQA